jgi:hypothetical protein
MHLFLGELATGTCGAIAVRWIDTGEIQWPSMAKDLNHASFFFAWYVFGTAINSSIHKKCEKLKFCVSGTCD